MRGNPLGTPPAKLLVQRAKRPGAWGHSSADNCEVDVSNISPLGDIQQESRTRVTKLDAFVRRRDVQMHYALRRPETVSNSRRVADISNNPIRIAVISACARLRASSFSNTRDT